MVKKLDHIGIAVRDLEKSRGHWKHILPQAPSPAEEVENQGVKVAQLKLPGGGTIELLAPLRQDSPIEKFLRERGEGIHHICFEVEDIEEAMATLNEKGIRMVQEKPGKGAGGSLVAFVHPKSLNGVLLELKQKSKDE